MDCAKIKKIIPDFLEGALEAVDRETVRDHLAQCQSCKEVVIAHEKTWDLIGIEEDIEPEPGYVSRFWTRLTNRKSWWEKTAEAISPVISIFKDKRFIPIMVTACVVLIVGLSTVRTTIHVRGTEALLTALSVEEIEFIENIELAENLEVIEDIEFYEDFEIIENLELLEA